MFRASYGFVNKAPECWEKQHCLRAERAESLAVGTRGQSSREAVKRNGDFHVSVATQHCMLGLAWVTAEYSLRKKLSNRSSLPTVQQGIRDHPCCGVWVEFHLQFAQTTRTVNWNGRSGTMAGSIGTKSTMPRKPLLLWLITRAVRITIIAQPIPELRRIFPRWISSRF